MNKILLVEDEQHIATLQIEILSHAGYEVVHKINGMEAYVEFKQNDFDYIITDLMMPIMDGKQLIDLIRANNKQIPIVVISALNDNFTKERAKELGANSYLEKPFSIAELVATMDELKIESEVGEL